MSKMREALRSAIQAGVEICKTGEMPGTRQNRIDHIIRRYGDLEFTWDEVRGMLEDKEQNPAFWADEIIYRHNESKAEEDARENHRALFGDETPTIKASEIEAVTGQKVPEEMHWVFAHNGVCYFSPHKPINDGSWAPYEPGWQRAPDGLKLHDPWQDSLCRIIHDSDVDPRPRSLDREVGELTKRVAAIEKRVLAGGHADSCPAPIKCTCGYVEIGK